MNKYRNIKTVIDGITFASKAEAWRYLELMALKKAMVISDLVLQPKWAMKVNGVKICSYVADFAYREKGNFWLIVEDVKGIKTPVYRLKKKLMKAIHGIDIKEVK